MNNEKIKDDMKDNFKKSSNKNLVLAALGIIALIILIIFSLISKKEETLEIPPYQTTEENKLPSYDSGEPFSNIDIDGDGKEEQVPRAIVESKILMLTEDNNLYIISPIDKKKELLLEGVSAYASSNDKNYIAYIKKCTLTEEIRDCNTNIHIYDLKTKQEKYIATIGSNQRSISWSPDNRYIIVDSGTSASKSYRVYSFETGEVNKCNFSGSLVWVSNVETLSPLYLPNLPKRPYEVSDALGIGKYNIETCQIETLINPTDTDNFSVVKLIDNQLIVRRMYVDKVEDWVDSSKGFAPKIAYLKYDFQTKQMTPYPEYEDNLKSETNRLKSLVPKTAGLINIFTSDKNPITGWELINVHRGGSVYNNVTYLMGPDETVVKISEDAISTWL